MHYLSIFIKLTGSFMVLTPMQIVYSSLVCSYLEYYTITEEKSIKFWTAFLNKFIYTGYFSVFFFYHTTKTQIKLI